MDLKLKMKHIYNKLENLLFENHSCISCAREIPDGTNFSLCTDCLNNMSEIKDDFKVINYYNSKDYHFNKSISFYKYGEVSSSIIKSFKYSNKRYYAKYIAKLMTQNLDYFKEIDFLTFVPLTNKKLRKRGYNQSQEIANEISKITNIPVKCCLTKIKETTSQAELSKEERLVNLKNSFEITDEGKEILGKNVIIIDDVFTTGTTLSRCAKELKKLKPKLIVAMTFAKAELHSDYYFG